MLHEYEVSLAAICEIEGYGSSVCASKREKSCTPSENSLLRKLAESNCMTQLCGTQKKNV